MTEAFTNALTNPKVIALVAALTAKEIIKSKANPTNVEEGLVKNHVLFAQEGSESGKFMTVKDITEVISEFNKDLTIRPRVFGKALISEAAVTKQSNNGRVYFIETVVKEITASLLENIQTAAASTVDVKDVEEVSAADDLDAQNAPLTPADLDDMVLTELLEVKEAFELKIKKAKKMDADQLREILKAFLTKEAPAPEEKEEVLVLSDEAIDALMSEYGDVADYKEILSSFSRKKLIKHINKFAMPIITENRTEEEITESIIEAVKETVSVKEPAKEAEQAPEKKEKKDKKKNKKNKKKNKKAKD